MEQEVMAYWPRENGCGPGWCLPRGFICTPRGDDARILFSVFDVPDNDEFDISGASEIVFVVGVGEFIGGNIYPGGAVLIEKRLSDGEIIIAGSLYQFLVDVTSAETMGLPSSTLYYEVQVTTSSGLKKTVSSGIFKSENTMIKDI